MPHMPKLVTCNSREEKEILVRYLRTGNYPDDYTKEQKRSLRRKAEHFLMVGDDICFKAKQGLLKAVFEYEADLIQHLIHTENSLGHAGINKMIDLMNQKYYGINKAYISAYVRSCESCSRFNS